MKLHFFSLLIIVAFAVIVNVVLHNDALCSSDKIYSIIASDEQTTPCEYVCDEEFYKITGANGTIKQFDISKVVKHIALGNECAINLGVKIYITSVNKRNADLSEIMSLSISEVYTSKPYEVLRSISNNKIYDDELLGAMLLVVDQYKDGCSTIIDELKKRYEATRKVNDKDLLEIRSLVINLFKKKIDLYKRECR